MKKLNWERDYSYEGTQERGNETRWWKAKWFVLAFHVFGVDGTWRYYIYGNTTLKSTQLFGSKEDAFQAVEDRLGESMKELA